MHLGWYFFLSLGIFTFYIPFFTIGLSPLIYNKFVNIDKVNLYNNNSLYNTISCNYDDTIKIGLELNWINKLNRSNKNISIINKLGEFPIEYVSVIKICNCLKIDERNLEIFSYDCYINNFKFVPNIMLSIFIILFGGGLGILIVAPIILIFVIMKDIFVNMPFLYNVKVDSIHSLESLDSTETVYTK